MHLIQMAAFYFKEMVLGGVEQLKSVLWPLTFYTGHGSCTIVVVWKEAFSEPRLKTEKLYY